MKLFTYFRSSAAYRVRIALNLKNVPHDAVPIHLVKNGGEQYGAAYGQINPQNRVPALALDDGRVITQSLAIIDYLETTYPDPPLYPADPVDKARSLALALVIGADIHPLNNLRVLKYLKNEMGHDQSQIDAWYVHWIADGFKAVEALIEGDTYCFGDKVTVADLFLAPQVYNARRFKVDMTPFPKIVAVDQRLMALPAFGKAEPSAQPDAE
jgi:maleylacetoacetate isomerase